jgi:hypothetical protein
VSNNPFGDGDHIIEVHYEWVKSLKLGAKVDYLKKGPYKKIQWVPAIVIDPLKINGRIELQYIYEKETSVSFSVVEIRPFGSKKEFYEWR